MDGTPREPVVAIERLSVTLPGRRGPRRVLRDVSLALPPGGSLGIVGESGSGKSMTALAVMRLLPRHARLAGSIRLAGEELTTATERRMCALRGARMGMIFQEPMTSLNPAHTIARQIGEGLRLHRRLAPGKARAEALRLLDLVGIPDAARRLDDYPHQLSGGQRQRVMIAIALACRPDVLIADEPTTALDVTVQAQILDLLAELRQALGMALVLISHDLGVVSELCDRVAVMYAGTVMEEAPAGDLFGSRAHPYTRGLLGALPRLDAVQGMRLAAIPGTLPDPEALPPGCAFGDRCPLAIAECRSAEPPLDRLAATHLVRCIRAGEAA